MKIDMFAPGRTALKWIVGPATLSRAGLLLVVSVGAGVLLGSLVLVLVQGVGEIAFDGCRAGGASESECVDVALLRARLAMGAFLPWVLGALALCVLVLFSAPVVGAVAIRRRRRVRVIHDRMRRAEDAYARGHLDSRHFAEADARMNLYLAKGVPGERERERAAVGTWSLCASAAPLAALGYFFMYTMGDGFGWSHGPVFPGLKPYLLLPTLILMAYWAATVVSEWRRGLRGRREHELAFESAWRTILDAAHDGARHEQPALKE